VSVAEKPAVLREGERITGDLEVIALLRRSRTFDVYDVFSDSRDCRCVAKLPRPDRADDERTRRRLRHEARMLLSCTHPHLVRAYELHDEPVPVLVLETLSGETLEHALSCSGGPLPLADVALLASHVCSALHYLHGRGIVHLDLKPANIVVDLGRVKLLDLSIARAPGPVAAGTGSRRHMAPEQARGGDVGPPADVWGAGCVLFHALTGRAAFGARPDGFEQLERRAEPLLPGPQLPRAIASVVNAALDPRPEARPTVEELADVLDGAIPG